MGTKAKKVTGWVFVISGASLIIFSIGYFFLGSEPIVNTGDPVADVGFTVGRLIYFCIGGFMSLVWGARMVGKARVEEAMKAVEEIRQLAEERESEWLEETQGNIPLPQWLDQKGYLDKYKSRFKLDLPESF